MMEYFKAFGHSIINPSIIKLPCWSEYISAMPARALFFVLTQRTKSQVSKEVSLRTRACRTSRHNHGPKTFAAFALLACASGKNLYALTAALPCIVLSTFGRNCFTDGGGAESGEPNLARVSTYACNT